MSGLTHMDAGGDARMVDVGEKAVTERVAVAAGTVRMARESLERVKREDLPKGAVLGAARIAGIMAAKRTSELIPLCHQIALSAVSVEFELDASLPGVAIRATARTRSQTGVEMEALTAVSVAALTLYDMVKGIDKGMEIGSIRLVHKSGGRSGEINNP